MKFGIIGSAHGHIFSFISDMLKLNWEFSGIWNDGSSIAASIAEMNNIPLFDDMNELFAQGIEVAGTAAVNNRKIDILEACEKHNVHIMADKPIIIDEAQYERLEKVICSGNIQVGLMLSVRFMPAVHTLKKLIDKGVIGQLTSVEIFNPHKLTPASRPDWHFDRKQGGGIAIDLLAHSIDTFQWLTGNNIIEYNGIMTKSMLKKKPDFYDASQFMVLNQAGVSGYFRVDWHIPEKHWSWGDIRIFCTGAKGLIEVRAVGDPVTREPQVILYGIDGETRNIEIEDSGKTETTDFIDRIMGKDHSITHKDILETARLSVEFDKCAKAVKLV